MGGIHNYNAKRERAAERVRRSSSLSDSDKALIAMLYEGGFRISELGTMTLKDVSFDRYGVLAMVNGKTGMRRERLIWSMPYVA